MDTGLVTAPGPVGGGLTTQLVGSHWYRVAALAPRLRPQLRLHAHRYRGLPWTVVEDRLNGRYHRFDQRAARLINRFDGHTTLAQLWRQLAADPRDDTPSQDDILALLGQLHSLDLLAPDSLPDLLEQGRRERRQSRWRRAQQFLNPLALRMHLVDPDRLLTRMVAAMRPLLGRVGAALWLVWVLPAVALGVVHGRELSGNFAERMLALDNLMLLWLIFPFVKALHELGHGLAVKRYGGEVHDMGIMLLIFVPVPYVEASSAWAFADKRARMLVGGAGMLAELALAAGAFYLWLWLEPGLARAACYDVAVLASVTTVIFNGNPLLRYDGYYIACDALEIPNLAQRASRWWAHRVERWLTGRNDSASPATAPGEAGWFAVYAPASFAYRLFVMFSIAVFVSTQYVAVGVFIALWSIVSSLGVPIWRGLGGALKLATGSRGRRAVLVALAVSALLLFALPLPLRTQVDGVLWLPDSGVLRASQAGFAQPAAAQSGQAIAIGERVVALVDPLLSSRVAVAAARESAARVRWEAARVGDPARAAQLRSPWEREAAELANLSEHAARLDLRSPIAGRLWLNGQDDLPGLYLKQGQIVGYVVPDAPPVVRVIVDQTDADLIRFHTGAITVRLPAEPGRTWAATVHRTVPAASHDLPSAALGRQGGGAAAVDPRDDSGRRALQTHFEIELALPADFPYRLIGGRISVRFEHPDEALAWRIGRGVRHLFLAYVHS